MSAARSVPTQPPAHEARRTTCKVVGWENEEIGLDNSTLITIEALYRAAKGKERWKVNRDLRSVLTTLLPLVDQGWTLSLLTLRVDSRRGDACRVLERGCQALARRNDFSSCGGFVFRHVGRNGGPDLHVVLASPPGAFVHARAKGAAWEVTDRLAYPRCTALYLRGRNGDGKRFWPELTRDERREALERTLLYLVSQYLSPRRRHAKGQKRVTPFRAAVLPPAPDRPPEPFPLLIARRLRFDGPAPLLSGRRP